MTLSFYIMHLQKILEEDGDIECWYCRDDEGNYFQKVNYIPETMVFIKSDYCNLHDMSDYAEILEDGCDCEKVVCVN